MRVLVCGASPTEARACSRGIRRAGLHAEFEVLTTGLGFQNAERALSKRLASGPRPELIISSGLAGAVTGGLRKHSWITAREIIVYRSGAFAERYQAVPLVPDPSTEICSVVSSPELIKASSWPAGQSEKLLEPIAVDMESAALAKVAGAAGVRIGVWRVISDTPAEPLPEFLVSVAGALSAQRPSERILLGLRSLRSAAHDWRGVANLAKALPRWSRLLSEGWMQNAVRLQELSRKS